MTDATLDAVQTVAVTSDTRSLLNALRATFSTSVVTISELMQNARRAGATFVAITLEDDTLTVVDNGGGIGDFQKLLAIAQSGWSEVVQREDTPYGIGFVSALFSCDRLIVTSRTGRLDATTEMLLDLNGVAIEPIEHTNMTTIKLVGQKIGSAEQIRCAVERFAEGFPIAVTFNGADVPRSHAAMAHPLVRTPVGLVSACALEGEGIDAVYLQGLPIEVKLHGTRYYRYSHSKGILHLDPTVFHGRMPDRDCLLNPQESVRRLLDGLDEAARAHMLQQADLYRDHHFVEKFGTWARDLGMVDLLNRMDYIPGRWVGQYGDTPRVGGYGAESALTTPNGVLSREQLQKAGLFLYDQMDDELIAAHALHGAKAYVADGHDIPEWHWASKLAIEITSDDVDIRAGTEIGSETFEIYGNTVTLSLVESLDVVPREGFTGLPVAIPTDVYYDDREGVLYATSEASSYDAVWQVSNFQDDDIFEEDREQEAQRNFEATVAVLRDKDPAALLTTFLQAGLPWSRPGALRGQRFSVAFDAEGKLQVAVEQAKAA